MNKKLRKFILNEIEFLYEQASLQPDPHEAEADAHVVETLEDLAFTLFAIPDKAYRTVVLKRFAVFFEESEDYREEWRP